MTVIAVIAYGLSAVAIVTSVASVIVTRRSVKRLNDVLMSRPSPVVTPIRGTLTEENIQQIRERLDADIRHGRRARP